MFFKKSKPGTEESSAEVAPEIKLPKGHTPAKGAPTPRRKEVEARRRRPIVSNRATMTPEEKKAFKAEERARSNELYAKEQEAMRTGDERNMPPQHKGKVRRFGRDFVDASAPFAAFFMPTAILLIPLLVVNSRYPQIGRWIVIALYAVFILMLLNGFFVAWRAKKLAERHFGANQIPRGFLAQMMGRSFYLRRWRLPSPQVKRGEFPEGAAREQRLAVLKFWQKNS
ncbi:MAG: DUF3043 domain-containing protein [Trueperella sp.]|nr:DUF3043 domain-containing protein [Trueperella sp.]